MTLRGVEAMHHIVMSFFNAEDVMAIEILVGFPKRGPHAHEKHLLFGLPCGCRAALTTDEVEQLARMLANGADDAPTPAMAATARTISAMLLDVVKETEGMSRHGLH